MTKKDEDGERVFKVYNALGKFFEKHKLSNKETIIQMTMHILNIFKDASDEDFLNFVETHKGALLKGRKRRK